jgi:predicted AlkP superfamily pyrophosphatase or phosphodiesterase
MTTGKLPREHGVVANGFYWRDRRKVEMWTSPNECIEKPQLWDLLYHREPRPTTAVWFPLHSKEAGADYVCTPAPIHNPDGSESLWCYTRPMELYGALRDQFGHFPLQHFWGPLANVKSSVWIAETAMHAASQWQPDFFYVYLSHLDYDPQRYGPDSPQAQQAVVDLDRLLGRLGREFREAYDEDPLWLVAGEYAIAPVDHVAYPNRLLREAGLLAVRESDEGEQLDLVDHQHAHVFVEGSDPAVIRQIVDLFRGREGFADVLIGDERRAFGLDHPRSGDAILVSAPNSWQAYYWWLSDDRAPRYARTVDIHRKPGYDPVELFFDFQSKTVPLDATLVKGSHGAPVLDESQRTVLLASQPGLLPGEVVHDVDVFPIVLNEFGMRMEG